MGHRQWHTMYPKDDHQWDQQCLLTLSSEEMWSVRTSDGVRIGYKDCYIVYIRTRTGVAWDMDNNHPRGSILFGDPYSQWENLIQQIYWCCKDLLEAQSWNRCHHDKSKRWPPRELMMFVDPVQWENVIRWDLCCCKDLLQTLATLCTTGHKQV